MWLDVPTFANELNPQKRFHLNMDEAEVATQYRAFMSAKSCIKAMVYTILEKQKEYTPAITDSGQPADCPLFFCT